MVLAVILAKETLFDRTTARLSQPATRWAGTVAAIEQQPRAPSQRPPLDRPGDRLFSSIFSPARAQS
ncbi:hypothetical protein QUB05_20295 [Microcoleus sp. F10-C6]|uniref:hypothetical protein n=1 Tax=unclassified Microcoleus TaxID=2642155 RepID=UPI002FD4C672